MKIGIVSDTHFGYSRWPEDAYNQGREAILTAAKDSDILLIPGDIFDKENPSINTISQVIKILLELEKQGWGAGIIMYDDDGNVVKSRLPIAVIHGTHERVDSTKTGPVKLIDFTKYWIDVHNHGIIFEKDGEKVRIFGMGGVPESLARDILNAINPQPKNDMFNVFVLHQTFNEFMPFKSDEFLSFEDLPNGFDLYVNGHIHKYHVDLNGKFIIPGSTVITQLKPEEQKPKGFVIYDTSNRTHKFIDIHSRPFKAITLNFDNAESSEIIERVNDEVDKVVNSFPDTKPIIRVILTGTLAKGLKSSDVTFTIRNPKAFKIYVDNQFEGYTIESTLKKVKNMRRDYKDPKKIGYTILSDKLKDIKFRFPDPERLFDAVSESADKGMEYVEHVKLSQAVKPDEDAEKTVG